jgi:GT2 family glycosyltransferase
MSDPSASPAAPAVPNPPPAPRRANTGTLSDIRDAAAPLTSSDPAENPTENPVASPVANRVTPSVAAIVVSHSSGRNLPQLLEGVTALAAQDIAIPILVIDRSTSQPRAAGEPVVETTAVSQVSDELGSLLAQQVPDAYVRIEDASTGWAHAANTGAGLVQGAEWLLFCHDGVAPAPDAVRLLVETAIAENADIAVPKIVQWDNHELLVSIGANADRSGRVFERVDAGEIDQGQHDFVSTITGCGRVRRDVHGGSAG